jgi:2-phosphoglycerate kinase
MASLLLVTGPPGAGKSTVAGMLVERFDHSVLVEGDSFFGFLRRGAVAPWLPEANGQNEVVTRAAASAAGQYVAGGYAAVYDGVVGAWFLPTFAAATGLGRVHYVVLLPSVERCLARVTARQGHGFTDEAATRKMHGEFARAEIDQRHVFVDRSDEVEAVVDRILEAFAGGELAYRTSSP